MSFLFDKKTKKTMRWVWVFFSAIIILSMTLAFSGGSGLFSSGGSPNTASGPTYEEIQEVMSQIDRETISDEALLEAIKGASEESSVPFEVSYP